MPAVQNVYWRNRQVQSLRWDMLVGEIVGETGASCTECLLEKQTSAKFEVGHVTVELPSVIHSYLPPYTS